MSNNKDYLSQLHRSISDHFNLEELRTLCFELGFDYDDLGGEGKSDKVRELILNMVRAGNMNDLLNALSQKRPKTTWLLPPDNFEEILFEKKASLNSLFFTPPSSLSSQEILQKLQKWFKWNKWVDKQSYLKLNSEHNLRRHYWPIFVYTGSCNITYTIRRHKRYDTRFVFPKSRGVSFPILEPEGWYRFEKSKTLPIKLALLASQYLSTNVAANELFYHTMEAVSGLQSGIKPQWQPLIYLINFGHISSRLLSILWYFFIEGMTSSLYESSNPKWPNVNRAKVGNKSFFQNCPHIKEAEVSEQFRSQIRQELSKAAKYAEHSQIKKEDIIYSGERLLALKYPFWTSEIRGDKEKQTVVIDGITGKILFASLSVNKGITIALPD